MANVKTSTSEKSARTAKATKVVASTRKARATNPRETKAPTKAKQPVETFKAVIGQKVKYAVFDENGKPVKGTIKTAKVEATNGFGHLILADGVVFNKQGGRREPGQSVAANMKQFPERIIAVAA